MDKTRRIWLRLARYVVEKKNDIKQAMKFLEQCQGLVKIEDILPFFPDFVTIDDFKGAICDSLQEYSQNIKELQVGKSYNFVSGDSAMVIFIFLPLHYF